MNARRGWVRAQERGRVAVARELARLELEAGISCGMCQGSGEDDDTLELEPLDCGMCEGTGSGRRVLALALLSDPAQGFDVHRAREHARSLIALEAEQAAFEDWTRAQGKGPECRKAGAFMAITKHSVFEWLPSDGTLTYGDGRSDGTQQGGLDVYHEHRKLGRLALDAGPDALASLVFELRALGFEPTIPGGWPGKLARQWGGDSRAPMGRAYARLGRRILDALEGQPDACEGCLGSARGYPVVRGPFEERGRQVFDVCSPPCPDCRGSGHNLRGVLAPIEWSPQVRRRRTDQVISRVNTPDTWLDALGRMAPGSGVLKTMLTDAMEIRRTEFRERTLMWGNVDQRIQGRLHEVEP